MAARPLKNAFDRPIAVEAVEDVGEQMTPQAFWARVSAPAGFQPSAPGTASSPWKHRLIRRYFFGADLSLPQRARDRLEKTPHLARTLGRSVPPEGPELAVAADIRHKPFVRPHRTYSRRYYPRSVGGYVLNDLYPAYVLTGEERFRTRAEELLAFLLFSQYDADGNNGFVATYFADDLQRLKKQGLAQRWNGGFDYLFDWEWRDAYGYRWSLHEPDHHVNSLMAVSLVRGYEMTGNTRYLDSACRFVYNQVPRYGWHTGLWNGRRYYWTEYNPGGAGCPSRDATDNVQAFVAQAVAMAGYYKKDPRLLEYARGLLWYLVREFETDGRWYYDGAENPLNSRRVESHELTTLRLALRAVPYLLKAGIPMDEELAGLEAALDWHLRNLPELAEERDGRAWKLVTPVGTEGDRWRVTTFFQATGSDVAGARFVDTLPPGVRAAGGLRVRFSRLAPPEGSAGDWTIDKQADVINPVSHLELRNGLKIPLAVKSGDVLRISYDLHAPGEKPLRKPEPSLLVLPGAGEASPPAIRAKAAPLDPAVGVTDASFPALAARLEFPFLEGKGAEMRTPPTDMPLSSGR